MLPQETIRKKRDKQNLTKEEIAEFILGVTDGRVSEGQIASLAMAVYLNGMTRDEAVALTIAMRDSGEVLDWSQLDGAVLDKHSTGGVGDNVSLMLAPAIAALLIYAALATTFDGLQATASMALRAQGVVWVPSAIHIASFFVLMIPLCYVMGVSMERGARGMMEAVTITLLVASALQWGLLEWKTARR